MKSYIYNEFKKIHRLKSIWILLVMVLLSDVLGLSFTASQLTQKYQLAIIDSPQLSFSDFVYNQLTSMVKFLRILGILAFTFFLIEHDKKNNFFLFLKTSKVDFYQWALAKASVVWLLCSTVWVLLFAITCFHLYYQVGLNQGEMYRILSVFGIDYLVTFLTIVIFLCLFIMFNFKAFNSIILLIICYFIPLSFNPLMAFKQFHLQHISTFSSVSGAIAWCVGLCFWVNYRYNK